MFFSSGEARTFVINAERRVAKKAISPKSPAINPRALVRAEPKQSANKGTKKLASKGKNKLANRLGNKGMSNRCPNACRSPRKQTRRIEIVPHPSNRRRYIICWKNGRFQCRTCGKENVFRIRKRRGRCVPRREQEEVSTGEDGQAVFFGNSDSQTAVAEEFDSQLITNEATLHQSLVPLYGV